MGLVPHAVLRRECPSQRHDNRYRVVFEPQDGKAARLNWIANENGQETRHTNEPAGSGRRFEATIIDWFLPEELL